MKNKIKKHLSILVILKLSMVILANNLFSEPFAYVGSTSTDVLYVIDTSTDSIIDTIPLDDTALRVAISPDGKFAYAGLDNAKGVAVIETSSNTVVNIVPIDAYISGITYLPSGTHVYVTTILDTIFVIDTATQLVSAEIALNNAESIVAHSDSSKVYITRQGSIPGNLVVIETSSNTILSEIPVGTNPDAIAIHPDGSKVYVANQMDSSVSVIDTTTNTVIETVTVGFYPVAISVHNDGSTYYVVNLGNRNISIVDVATNVVTGTIDLNGFYLGIDIHPNGNLLYAVGQDVAIVDLSSQSVVANIPITNVIALSPFITPIIEEILPLDILAIEMEITMTEVLTDSMNEILNDPDIPDNIADDIQDALDNVIGNKGGKANNGATDKLLVWNLVSSLRMMIKGIEDLQDAETAGYDTLAYQAMIADFAQRALQFVIEESITELGASHPIVINAIMHYDIGSELLGEQDFIGAINKYIDAAQTL